MKKVVGGIIIILVSALIYSCSGKKEHPEMAAKMFFEALANKDFKKAGQLATTDSKTLLNMVETMWEMGTDLPLNLGDRKELENAVYTTTEMEGDKATVSIRVKDHENRIHLVKEKGEWKVAVEKEVFEEALKDAAQDSSKSNPEK